jgi:hypothetical protein
MGSNDEDIKRVMIIKRRKNKERLKKTGRNENRRGG